MGHPPKRDKRRAISPSFMFTTKALRGEPKKDSPDERAEKDRKVKEFMERKGKK